MSYICLSYRQFWMPWSSGGTFRGSDKQLYPPDFMFLNMCFIYFMFILCFFSSEYRVLAGYFYLKRGRSGPAPPELFDYVYVHLILTSYFIHFFIVYFELVLYFLEPRWIWSPRMSQKKSHWLLVVDNCTVQQLFLAFDDYYLQLLRGGELVMRWMLMAVYLYSMLGYKICGSVIITRLIIGLRCWWLSHNADSYCHVCCEYSSYFSYLDFVISSNYSWIIKTCHVQKLI